MPESSITPQFVSKNRVREILESAKAQGLEPKQVFTKLAQNPNYEIEGFNATFDPLAAVTNIPESLKELGSSIINVFRNPLQTAKGISVAALGLLDKAAPETSRASEAIGGALGSLGSSPEQAEQTLGALADFFVERYGSVDKVLNTVEKDPAGFVADLSTVLTGGAGAAKGVTSAVAKAGIISTRMATRLSNTAAAINRVGNLIDPVNVAASSAKIPFQAIKNANEAVGIDRMIKTFNVDAKMKEALQLNPSQKINITRSTFTPLVGERLAKWGVSGTLEEMSSQLAEIAEKSQKVLDSSLAGIGQVYKSKNTSKILDQLYELRKPEVFTAQQFQDMRKRIVQLQVKHENNGLTLSELNEIKRLADKIAQDKVYKATGDLKASNIAQNLGTLRKNLRQMIEAEAGKHGVTNVFELNNQNAFARSVKEAIDKKVLAGAPRKSLSLEVAKASTLIIGQVKGALYQVIRSPRFQSDLATAIQLLKDGDYQKLAGGVTFARKPPGKAAERLMLAAGKAQFNREALAVMDKVLQSLQKAYPALRGVRLTGEATKQMESE